MFLIPLEKLSDQERHDYILKTFILNKSTNPESQRHKRDIDVIKEHHRFLWNEDNPTSSDSWETRLARRYYDKLFKEYCIADLTRHKENKVALRWRTEAEVITGKGQFQCGSRNCEERSGLRSWEVNFAYMEQGRRKNALVKLRLCANHSHQLNYTSRKREVKRLKRFEKQSRKRSKDHNKHPQRLQNESQYEGEDTKSSDDDEEREECRKSSESLQEMNLDKDLSSANAGENEDIWSKKIEIDLGPYSRESEFERYLEDLLL